MCKELREQNYRFRWAGISEGVQSTLLLKAESTDRSDHIAELNLPSPLRHSGFGARLAELLLVIGLRGRSQILPSLTCTSFALSGSGCSYSCAILV